MKNAHRNVWLILVVLFPFWIGGPAGFVGMLKEGTPFFANLHLYLTALGMTFIGFVGVYFAFKHYNKVRSVEMKFR